MIRFLSRLWHEEQGAAARQDPRSVGAHRRRPLAAVLGRLAAPQPPPAMAEEGRDERLACGREVEVAAEIHDEQAVAPLIVEITQQECAVAEHGPLGTLAAGA